MSRTSAPRGALILAVDDDPDLRDLVALALRAGRHEVLTAADGPTALALASARPPDLVVTDYQMPGMTGVELAERLPAATGPIHVPIVMITAVATVDDDIVGPGRLIDRWLSKPFSPRN